RLLNADRVLFDSVELQGIDYTLWESNGTVGNIVEVYNSKILGTNAALATSNSTWHIFSSELKALRTGSESAVDTITAVQLGGLINVTIWGSHIHAESSHAGLGAFVLGVRVPSASTGSGLDLIGTQVHVKIGTTDIGLATDQMFAVDIQGASSPSHFN